jgi:hypothetical protein
VNWEIVGSTGEWAGAIAVVTTLFYLARQIRQQNKIAEYSAWKDLMGDFNEFNRMFLEDTSRGEIYSKGLNNPDDLSDQEVAVFNGIFRIGYNNILNLWKAYSTGNLPKSDWEGIGSWFAYEVTTPGGRKWRQLNESVYPEFWEAIDKLEVDEGFSERIHAVAGENREAT